MTRFIKNHVITLLVAEHLGTGFIGCAVITLAGF